MTKNDDTVAIRNAILTNTAIKIIFGGLDPDDADLMARLLFSGHLDLAEWKPGSERPVAVGYEKAEVSNWSRAEMRAQSSTRSRTLAYSRGSARGAVTSTSAGDGSGTSVGTSAGMVLSPPLSLLGPNAPNATFFPMPLSQSVGQSSSENSFAQTSEASAMSSSIIETESEADTEAFGDSRGSSQSEGTSEVFVTQYEWLPSAMYSLPEQLHRVIGQLMNLPPREVFVKIRGGKPFRTRTADLPPAFRSAEFKRLMLPRYRSAAASNSPYIRTCDAVDAELAARCTPASPQQRKEEPESWGEALEYPDPPPPPDAARARPVLRVIRSGADDEKST